MSEFQERALLAALGAVLGVVLGILLTVVERNRPCRRLGPEAS